MKKKEPDLQQVNHAVLQHLNPDRWRWKSVVLMSLRCVAD